MKTVVERRMVSQTVVHNHITQVVHKAVFPRRDTVYRFLPQSGTEGEREERSRPTLAAKRLVRLFSAESARRELQPFFRTVVRSVLAEERELTRSRPEQGLSLVFRMFGERLFLQTLSRLREELRESPAVPAQAPPPSCGAAAGSSPRLTGAEYQALLKGVERSLGRRSRLEMLRSGRS